MILDASLAYLHASRKAANPEEKTRLTKKFDTAGSTVIDGGSETKLHELEEGLAKGEKLAAAVRNDELAWIEGGRDVSAEFTQKYLGHGTVP